jgi:putative ABC transport system permease protein
MAFETKDQVAMPLRKCMELVLSGVQYRIFRAAITVAIIALAVAFLMTILGDSLVERNVRRALIAKSAPRQNFLAWLQRLGVAMTESELTETISNAAKNDTRWEELRKWGGCDDQSLVKLQELAQEETLWLKFFSGLKEGQRRQLVGRETGRGILVLLQDEGVFRNLAVELKSLGVEIPKPVEDLRKFVVARKEVEPLRGNILKGHAGAVSQVKKLFDGRSVVESLAKLDAVMVAGLKELGFSINEKDLPDLKTEAARGLDAKHVEELLEKVSFKQKFAGRYNVKDLNKVSGEMLFSRLTGKNDVKWLFQQKEAEKLKLDQDRVREVALEVSSQKKMDSIEMDLEAATQGSGMFGFSNRVQWLIIVSLLVCAVGITNAMLMSVTERFREIATMKCLGATDGFIMINFLLESGLQGLAGGIIGGILGFILGILRASVACGAMAVWNIPFLEMIISFGGCLAVGVLLSVLAAIYPARVAARLAPLEAMRVE